MQIKCGTTDLTDRLLSYKRKVFFPEHRLIGNAPSSKVDIELINEDSFITDLLLQNTFEITEGSVKTGVFVVLDKPQKYTKKLSLELYDNMIKLDIPYKSQLDYATGTTIAAQLTEMQQLSGVSINTSALPSTVLSKTVGWIDTTYSIRTYIGWIAELAGMNALCDNNGIICFYNISTQADYNTTDLSDYSTEELWTLGRVCFDDGLSVYSYPSSTVHNTLYISNKNLYFDSLSNVQLIYNKYQNLSLMIADNIRMPGIDTIRLGQMIDYNNDFSFVVLDLVSSYTGGSYCDHDISGELETKETEGTVVRYDESVRIKKIQTTVDNVEQRLTIVAQDTASSVRTITYKYGYGTSATQTPDDTAFTYDNMPAIVDGLFIWRRSTILKNSGDTEVKYEMIQGATGPQGSQGPQGQTGWDGISITSTEPLWYLKDAQLHIELQGNTTQGENPLPSNPQTIHSVSGDNEIKIVGKNLLTSSTYKTGNNLYIGSTGTSYSIHLPAGTYTFTKSSNKSVGSYCKERNDSGNTQIISGHNGVKSATITLSGGDYRFWFYSSSGGVSKDDINYYQLEKGSTATAYEPYVEQVYPITLSDIELNKIGIYQDYFYKNDDKWYLHKATRTVDMGTLTWSYYSSSTPYFMYNATLPVVSGTTAALCSNYPCTTSSTQQTFRFNNQILRVYDSNYSDPAVFKADMNGVMLVYPLSTATDEEVIDTTLISQLEALSKAASYYEATSIFQTNFDLPFEIEYNETALETPVRPSAEVTTSSRDPEIWSLSPADYITGYRFYTTQQTHYSDDTVGWSNVVVSDSNYGFTQYEEVIAETKSLNAQFQIMSDQITSEVSATTALSTQVTDAQGNIRALQTTTENLQSAINQNSTSIELVVSNTTTLTNDLTNVTETVEDLSTHVIIQADGVKITEGSDDTSYTKVKASGMQIYAEGVLTAEAMKDGFNAPKIISGQWVQQPMNNGNSYGFFRKS